MRSGVAIVHFLSQQTKSSARMSRKFPIVEVLSDSAEAYDRGEKFVLYRQLPSLQEYLPVSQHRVGGELYTRDQDDRWILSDYNALTDCVSLASVDCTLAPAQVYDKLVVGGA